MRKKLISAGLYIVLLLTGMPAAQAKANSAAASAFSNPVTDILIVLMVVLLIVIAMLGKLLLDVAEVKLKKEKEQSSAQKVPVAATVLLLFFSSSLYAQTGSSTNSIVASSDMIAGMSSFAFYSMMTIIFLELFVILGLLFNIRSLLKVEKEKVLSTAEVQPVKQPGVNWWTKFNRFKPVEHEADIDLGHDYDGIRELDNRLPPWWIYGFYLTIIVAVIYLWRFHVSHTGLSGKEEYDVAVANADLEIKAYLAKKGDAVDEHTVTVLTGADDLAAGKTIFITSCAACHKASGAGDIGPNLTDNYWMHGGDIKSIFKTIRYGVNAMPQWQNTYSNKQIAQVSGYINSLIGSAPENAKPPQGSLYQKEGGVSDSTVTENKTTVKQ